MNVFFTNIIIGAIALLIIYSIKKIGDYSYSKRLEHYGEKSKQIVDEHTYHPALTFVHEAYHKK